MAIQTKRDAIGPGAPSDRADHGANVSRLKAGGGRGPTVRPPAPRAEVSEASLKAARRIVRERLRRNHFFKADLFADPAWDMMLDIFIAEAEGRETPVMNLCLSSQVPETTTLRWVRTLEHAGVFVRQRDEHDQRRVLVRLSPAAAKAMASYLDDSA